MPHTSNDDTVSHSDNGTDSTATWHTVNQACDILGVSRRTLWRRIEQDKIQSKLEGNRRLVLVTEELTVASAEVVDNSAADTVTDTVTDTPGDTVDGAVPQTELVEQLRSEVEYLRQRLQDTAEKYEEERSRRDEQHQQEKERDQMIIMQLTRQLEQSQRLLEYKGEPWYRKILRRRRDREVD